MEKNQSGGADRGRQAASGGNVGKAGQPVGRGGGSRWAAPRAVHGVSLLLSTGREAPAGRAAISTSPPLGVQLGPLWGPVVGSWAGPRPSFRFQRGQLEQCPVVLARQRGGHHLPHLVLGPFAALDLAEDDRADEDLAAGVVGALPGGLCSPLAGLQARAAREAAALEARRRAEAERRERAERERIESMSIGELSAEIERIRPVNLVSLTEADPAVIEARRVVDRLYEQLEASDEGRPLAERLQDLEPHLERAREQLRHARARAWVRISEEQRPARARVAELEALREQREREAWERSGPEPLAPVFRDDETEWLRAQQYPEPDQDQDQDYGPSF